MAALERLTLVAHGGVGGAIVETLVVDTLAAFFAAVGLGWGRARPPRDDDSEQG